MQPPVYKLKWPAEQYIPVYQPNSHNSSLTKDMHPIALISHSLLTFHTLFALFTPCRTLVTARISTSN